MTARVPRVLLLVCDSFGVGGAPDAHAYGDLGSDTLGNTARAVGGLRAPNLADLGLGHLTTIDGVPPRAVHGTAYGACIERSAGKDTTTGHWTYTLDPDKADSLAGGQVVHDTLTIQSTDGTAQKTIDVEVHGVNDEATIAGDTSGDVTEDGAPVTAGGTLSVKIGRAHV